MPNNYLNEPYGNFYIDKDGKFCVNVMIEQGCQVQPIKAKVYIDVVFEIEYSANDVDGVYFRGPAERL